jgi:geranylgeranyl diphosphate synthase type II
MLNHFIRTAQASDRERALQLLQRPRREKQADEVAWLLAAMREQGSIEHGRRLASEYCERALAAHDRIALFADDGTDERFLREMLFYVVDRIK